MSKLLPTTKRIKIEASKLYPDPNNPRFLTKDSDRTPDDNLLDATTIAQTQKKMLGPKDPHNIQQIVESIKENGFQPIDAIFVQQVSGKYIVLEGNRRIMAIHQLINDEATPGELKESLMTIEVLEIVDKIDGRSPKKSKAILEEKIAYLLGVRHHGSLKQWPPFSQAASIFQRYLEVAEQTEESFSWDIDIARKLAATLGIKVGIVKERITVYRGMRQLALHPRVVASESAAGEEQGGMKSRYYSVCKEALIAKSDSLADFIRVSDNLELDERSAIRMIELCHFDKRNREGSPINRPAQWRYLTKILDDENEARREENLQRVIAGKERPEDVWAERQAELERLEWHTWLDEITQIFKALPLNDLEDTEESREVIHRLTHVLGKLEENNE